MFIKPGYWKYIDVILKEIPDDFTEEDEFEEELFVRAIKFCKEHGKTPEETAKRLWIGLDDVRTVYELDDLELFDWSATSEK